jgi:hypothetical protein
MKFASRFGLAAITLAATITALSCTSQGPNAPVPGDQSLERGVGGYYPPPYNPDDPEVIPCQLSLGAPASEVLSDGIPFKLSCEDMAMATMKIGWTSYNSQGCLTKVNGSVTFSNTGHHYEFEMIINRTGADCALNGGYIIVMSPLLGDEKMIRLPSVTSRSSLSTMRAN